MALSHDRAGLLRAVQEQLRTPDARTASTGIRHQISPRSRRRGQGRRPARPKGARS